MHTSACTDRLRELIAHAWFTIGYPPARSLVLVAVDERGEPGPVARADQPPHGPPAVPGGPTRPASEAARRGTVEMLAACATRGGVRAAVVLVVQEPGEPVAGAPARPDGPGVPGGTGTLPGPAPAFGPAEAALVRTLRRGLRAGGIRLVALGLVGGGRVRSLDCADASCCPPGGAALGDLSTTVTAPAMVLRGLSVAADESALVADVDPAPWPPAVLLAEPAPAAPALGLARWRALHAARLRAPRPGPGPAAGEVAWLVPGLRDPLLRDAVLVSMLPGVHAAGARPRRRDPAADIAAGRVSGLPDLSAFAGRPPDREVFDAGNALLAAVARGAPAGERVEALAVLAWMAWWQGSGARGRLLAARALDDEPGHRLAGIVDQLLAHGVPPSWVPGVRPVPAPARDRRG